MYYVGQNLILRMDVEGVSLNGDVCIPASRVQVGSDSGNAYSPHSDVFWVGARVRDYASGILTCELFGHPGNVKSFFSQAVDPGIKKLVLTGGEILARLTGGNQPLPPQPKRSIRPFYSSSVHAPVAPGCSPERASLGEYPIREHQKQYKFRFDEMRIEDGAALFDADFDVPYFQRVRLELRIENRFLESRFDYIKSYLANRLGKHSVAIVVTIQTQGPKVIGTQATAPVVSEITPDLIGRVRHSIIRRELQRVEKDQELVTVDDFFNEDGLKNSNIKPTDDEFVEDLLAIRKPKHAEHIRYLSARHVHTLMRLCWVKHMDAFLFLLLAKNDCVFVLEKLNSMEATYFWRLGVTASVLSTHQTLLREKLEKVEQEISLIREHGRIPYRKDAPENFTFVEHDYKSKDGFSEWKAALDQVLNG